MDLELDENQRSDLTLQILRESLTRERLRAIEEKRRSRRDTAYPLFRYVRTNRQIELTLGGAAVHLKALATGSRATRATLSADATSRLTPPSADN